MDVHYVEIIERYLNGEMSASERMWFESELTTNDELAAQYKVYNVVENEMKREFGKKDEEQALKKNLASYGRIYIETSGSGQGKRSADATGQAQVAERSQGKVVAFGGWLKLAIAAAFLGVVSLGMIWYLGSNSKEPSGSQAANGNKGTPEVLPIPDSASSSDRALTKSYDPQLAKRKELVAMDAQTRNKLSTDYYSMPDLKENEAGPLQVVVEQMQQQEPEKAIASMATVDADAQPRGQRLVSASAVKFYRYYYKGICLLELDSARAAVNELAKASRVAPTKKLQSESQWYEALALLKSNKLVQANALLTRLSFSGDAGVYRGES